MAFERYFKTNLESEKIHVTIRVEECWAPEHVTIRVVECWAPLHPGPGFFLHDNMITYYFKVCCMHIS